MSAEIAQFPISDRKRTVDQVLDDMKNEKDVERVVVIGINEDQTAITLMNSQMTVAEVNFFLDRAKNMLLE